MIIRLQLGNDEPLTYSVSSMFANGIKILLDAEEKATRGAYAKGVEVGETKDKRKENE